MVEIEKFPCVDGNEARSRERYWYEQLNSTLNDSVPNRSTKERIVDLKVEIALHRKEYRIKNIDVIKINKQQYYQANKEEIINKVKENYNNNREEIQAKRNIGIVCLCGGKHTISTKARHCKSNKHQDYINSLV